MLITAYLLEKNWILIKIINSVSESSESHISLYPFFWAAYQNQDFVLDPQNIA